MTQMDMRPAHSPSAQLLFDWQLDIERLEREAAIAVQQRRSDHWTLAEAECSLDLIDAELVAARNDKGADPADVAGTVAQLKAWRNRVERLIGRAASAAGLTLAPAGGVCRRPWRCIEVSAARAASRAGRPAGSASHERP